MSSSPILSAHSNASADEAAAQLATFRAELDEIDNALHDLLMRRAGVVTRIVALGTKGRVALRAGREADIIRRLLERHQGPLPRGAIVRIWRELLAATTAMQGAYSVAVCDTGGGDYLRLAREHFGGLTRIRSYGSPMQAISEISGAKASVAVVPMPAEDEPLSAAWWVALLHRDDPRIYVVARLPFWQPPERSGNPSEALALAAVAPDPSGRDRSLIGLEVPRGLSRARLADSIERAGFAQRGMLVRRDPAFDESRVLIEVEGLVRDGDKRLSLLSDLSRPPVVLGAFAVPVGGDEP